MADAPTKIMIEEDDELSEISSLDKLSKRQLLSVNEVYWSASRQKIVAKIKSKSKKTIQLKL